MCTRYCKLASEPLCTSFSQMRGFKRLKLEIYYNPRCIPIERLCAYLKLPHLSRTGACYCERVIVNLCLFTGFRGIVSTYLGETACLTLLRPSVHANILYPQPYHSMYIVLNNICRICLSLLIILRNTSGSLQMFAHSSLFFFFGLFYSDIKFD